MLFVGENVDQPAERTEGEDSPWYPTAKLFRQSDSRDYASVLRRVRDEFEARIAAFRPEATGGELPTADGSASSPPRNQA